MLSIILITVVILCVSGKNEEYMGYKVYNVKLETEAQAARFNELKGDLIDFWRKPSLKHGVLGKAMVPASHTDWFENRLTILNITKDIFTEDVYDYLTVAEKTFKRTAILTASDDGDEDEVDENDTDNETGPEESEEENVFDFNAYYRYNQILAYLSHLENTYANTSIDIKVEEFGRTEYNRSLVYLKISQKNSQVVDKPVIVIESGIIPREWITIPAALNIVNRILEDTSYLDKADWIIIPVVNPDGYEYTHTNLRLWTKTLSTQNDLGFVCPGVNINRNFDVSWRDSDSSTSPCSHLFAGTEPFSEVESQMIRYLLDTFNERIKLYISLLNSGGFVSFPWQYEKAASGMFRQHLFLGFEMINAMNDEYILDVGWSALGDRASGTSSDYAQKSGVLYSLNIDMVQRGEDGVHIPEDQIVDVVEDVWRAIDVAVANILSE